MESLSLELCTLNDLAELRQLSLKTFCEAFEADNNPEDFQDYIGKAFSETQLSSELTHSVTRFFFLRHEGALAGYCKLNSNQAQTELREAEGMEVERIYVLGAWQGRGLGAWMLERIQELARSEGKQYLWLGVWEYNTGAIRFYERLGFVIFDKHPYYIGNDRQMDWMMRLDLKLKGPAPN